MVDKTDPVSLAKWGRNLPETERLLKQFCRMESSVDASAFNLRHIYMEQCSNPACSPHLTDDERAKVGEHMASGLPFEESVYEVLEARRAPGT